MTASEDNLILLRNKLKNPPLRDLFAKIALQPLWVEEQGRTLAYLHWPLELRGAVHRTLFPSGAPGADNRPLPPTPIFRHHLDDLKLDHTELDTVNSLPDELLYRAVFTLSVAGVGTSTFVYMQSLWAEGLDWEQALADPASRLQAQAVVHLVLGGLVDELRGIFCGREVDLLSEDHPEGLPAAANVDEVALPGPPEQHLGEEIEARLNQRRLQPLLRDQLLALVLPTLGHPLPN